MANADKPATKSGKPAGPKVTAKKPTRKNHAAPAAKKSAPATKSATPPTSIAAPRKGAMVEWAYGANRAIGKVLQVFSDKVTKTIKGTDVTRKATPQKPAVLVKTPKGDEALKSSSELKPARKSAAKSARKPAAKP
jgi:hypothetical protein